MKKLPVILMAGFEPFDGQSSNPSWEIAAALKGKRIAGHRVVSLCLPVAFSGSLEKLRSAIRENRPGLVVCLGLAGGRERIAIERIAININDARIADNLGHQPIDEAVVSNGPAAYFSTLPIKAMLAGLQQAGFPVEISQTAGTYVCNHVFYGLMHALRSRRKTRAGFIHVPPMLASPADAAPSNAAPGLPLETMVDAIYLALRIAVQTPTDQNLGGGAEY